MVQIIRVQITRCKDAEQAFSAVSAAATAARCKSYVADGTVPEKFAIFLPLAKATVHQNSESGQVLNPEAGQHPPCIAQCNVISRFASL